MDNSEPPSAEGTSETNPTGLAALQGNWTNGSLDQANFCKFPDTQDLEKIAVDDSGRIEIMTVVGHEFFLRTYPNRRCKNGYLDGENRKRFLDDLCSPPTSAEGVIVEQSGNPEMLAFEVRKRNHVELEMRQRVRGAFSKYTLKQNILIHSFTNDHCWETNGSLAHFYYIPVLTN